MESRRNADGRVVVISGSTRGIGYGLAASFLERGCRVVINGRSAESVAAAMARLNAGPDRLAGLPGDTRKRQDQQALWDHAVKTFGQVDIWINNAGIGHPDVHIADLSESQVNQVVDIDLKGLIWGCQVAITGMRAQGFGHLYNMEGFGSNGNVRPGLGIYGATKAAVRFINKTLAVELKGGPVMASALSPGIVITDFITEQYRDDPAGLASAKKIFNILGDKAETVTPWLADKVLANRKSGQLFNWLSASKVSWRFLTAGFNQRDLFS